MGWVFSLSLEAQAFVRLAGDPLLTDFAVARNSSQEMTPELLVQPLNLGGF